jgi:hypothetical protein
MDKNKNNLYVLPILINRHITSQSKEMTIKEMVNLDKILTKNKVGYNSVLCLFTPQLINILN